MTDSILKLSRNLLKLDTKKDFLSDQIHYQITVTILLISAFASTTLQYYADPIQCIQPAQFTEGYTSFARTLCWLNNTYFYPQTYTRLPMDKNERNQQTLRYYQWLPFIYLIQAFLFLFPHLFWISFFQRNGLNPTNLVNQALKFDKKSEISQRVAKEIERYLVCRQLARCKTKLLFRQHLTQQEISSSSPLILPNVSFRIRSHSSYLVFLYIFIKCLYVINILFQVFILNFILSTGNYGFLRFGIDTFKYLFQTSLKERLSTLSHQHQQLFPFVTLCDFHIRELGQDHSYTIECILLINIFYEKIFFALWIWFSIILIQSIVSLFYSIFTFFPFFSRNHFLKKSFHLIQSKQEQTYSLSNQLNQSLSSSSSPPSLLPLTTTITTNSSILSDRLRAFLDDQNRQELFFQWIQRDGIFLLHLLKTHAGERFLIQCLEDLIWIWIENYEDQSKLVEKLLKNQFKFS